MIQPQFKQIRRVPHSDGETQVGPRHDEERGQELPLGGQERRQVLRRRHDPDLGFEGNGHFLMFENNSEEILDILDSDGNADEARRDAEAIALFLANDKARELGWIA